jgi:hypothetical protein
MNLVSGEAVLGDSEQEQQGDASLKGRHFLKTTVSLYCKSLDFEPIASFDRLKFCFWKFVSLYKKVYIYSLFLEVYVDLSREIPDLEPVVSLHR